MRLPGNCLFNKRFYLMNNKALLMKKFYKYFVTFLYPVYFVAVATKPC